MQVVIMVDIKVLQKSIILEVETVFRICRGSGHP